MPASKPCAIIFDLWYTLICPEDFRDPGVHTSSQIAPTLGLDPEPFEAFWRAKTDERYRSPRLLHTYVEDYLASSGRSLTDDERVAFDAVWESHDLALANPRPDVLAALRGLVRSGHRLGLLSNANEREMRTWSASPLAPLFEATCFSFDIGCAKPEAEAYDRILAKLGALPSEAAFVGDGASSELRGAREVGIARVVFMRGFLLEQDVQATVLKRLKADADVAIEHIDQLHGALG